MYFDVLDELIFLRFRQTTLFCIFLLLKHDQWQNFPCNSSFIVLPEYNFLLF